ncbi:hypothetical protein GCM10009642_30310 [Nocardiopsis metallicus]
MGSRARGSNVIGQGVLGQAPESWAGEGGRPGWPGLGPPVAVGEGAGVVCGGLDEVQVARDQPLPVGAERFRDVQASAGTP